MKGPNALTNKGTVLRLLIGSRQEADILSLQSILSLTIELLTSDSLKRPCIACIKTFYCVCH